MTPMPQVAQQPRVAGWCNSKKKRVLDVVLASLALAVTAPFMLLIGVAIRATSPGPVLFRQWRSGLNGHPFQLLKFRTMHVMAPDSGPGVTRAGDARITVVGGWLRQWKVDEVPQLFNVLRGEMSIVGPRPDLEQFWRQSTEIERQALAVKPGLTGAATLAFSNEEKLLEHVPESELVCFYLRHILPRKARLDCEYSAHASFLGDCLLLLKTIAGIFFAGYNGPEIIPETINDAANAEWPRPRTNK